MGERAGPGSAGRPGGGTRRFDHLARYGRGRIIDETTGEYEWYADAPEGADDGFRWSQVLDAWPLIVADFAERYHIHLRSADLTWRDFEDLILGLRSCDSRLYRLLHANDEPEGGER